jgi:hypothetical protein
MPITFDHTFADGETLTHTKLNDNNNNISDKFNGGIVNADISGSAAIATSKLSGNTYSVYVNMIVDSQIAGGWPGAGTLSIAPLPGPNGTWTVAEVLWCCDDVGGGGGDFQIQYGTMAAGAFSSDGNVTSSTIIAAAGAGSATVSSNTLTKSATDEVLALVATGADATCMTGAANKTFHVMVRLTRAIGT